MFVYILGFVSDYQFSEGFFIHILSIIFILIVHNFVSIIHIIAPSLSIQL